LNRFLAAFSYITDNPVKAGLVNRSEEYEHNGIWHLRKGFYEVMEPSDFVVKLFFSGEYSKLLKPYNVTELFYEGIKRSFG
jgi:hypothetical protein